MLWWWKDRDREIEWYKKYHEMTCIDSSPLYAMRHARVWTRNILIGCMTKTPSILRYCRVYIKKPCTPDIVNNNEMEQPGLRCSPGRHCALRFAGSQVYPNRETNED